MSARDKDTKYIQDMLKVFYKKSSSAALPARTELVMTAEMERELSAEVSLPRRLRALRDLTEKALLIRITEVGQKKLWTCIQDILTDPNLETRHAVITLLCSLAEGQGEDLIIMRSILFEYLRDTHPTHPPEDSQLRFKLLYTLTNSGKNITCFEEQIGAFLLEWLPQIESPPQIIEFLQLIINVVKFNATYLDEEIVHGIVNQACAVCSRGWDAGVGVARAVAAGGGGVPSWKLMRSVLGADIGHATLAELVRVLRAAGGSGAGTGSAEPELVRGAVFHAGAALWGPRRVLVLQVSHLAVLPAFLKALECQNAAVAHEVAQALQTLVTRCGAELTEPAWDVVLQLLRALLELNRRLEPSNEVVGAAVHALLSAVEQLQAAGQYRGDGAALLDLLDHCAHERPEASAMRVVSARCAVRGLGGTARALALLERYVRRDPRPAVRLHALHALVAAVARDRWARKATLPEFPFPCLILELIFSLRANSFNCLGFCYDASGAVVSGEGAARLRPLCSPLLLCEPLGGRGDHAGQAAAVAVAGAGAGAGACAVGAGRLARAVTAALRHERRWAVAAAVLRALPAAAAQRAPALGRRAADLELLADALCELLAAGAGGGGALPAGAATRSELHALALPPLAALAPHHACLEPATQQRIVRCLLKYGMVLRSPQPYMNALTIFTLEMRDTMVKMLPEVLLELSKISDTKPIANPMLEFLSTLTRVPGAFASFVEDQYMSVLPSLPCVRA
ncbi:hypothetical protein ACJJTC_011812 [Scirpophaga incertulas]